MSILAPAKMRLWIEMWKEEVMASIPVTELQETFEEKQIGKGQLPPKTHGNIKPELEGGEHIL